MEHTHEQTNGPKHWVTKAQLGMGKKNAATKIFLQHILKGWLVAVLCFHVRRRGYTGLIETCRRGWGWGGDVTTLQKRARSVFFFLLYYTGRLQKGMTTSYSKRHVAKELGRPLICEEGMVCKHKIVGDGHKVHDHLSLGDYRDGLETAKPRTIKMFQLQALNLC